MKSNSKIASQHKKHFTLSKGKLSKQYANTRKCESFYAGDFMSYEDNVSFVSSTGEKRKALVKFNKVKPYVNAVKGFMAQNRRRPKYEARIENSQIQELFSTYANSISDYMRSNADADQVETQQDGDMLTVGYGAIETNLSYGEGYAGTEEEGELLMGRLDPKTVWWDPRARQTNLLDARWVGYTKEFDLDDAIRLFNDAEEEDFEEEFNREEDSNYSYFDRGGAYDKIAEVADYADEEAKIVKVNFYQWFEVESYYKIPNPLQSLQGTEAQMFADQFLQELAANSKDEFDPRGAILAVSKEDLDEMKEYFGNALGQAFEFKRKVFYSAIISGSHVFTKYRNISQQGYSILFKTGDYDASKNIWTGMVNSMMEPALYFNKALTELMYVIASNSKGGVMYEEGAIDDIAEFEANYAKTNGNVEVAEGALSGGKIQPKKVPYTPTGLDNIINIADGAMSDVNGFDPTFMGSREFSNDTAQFQRQRIKQVMSTLACYFDSASLYQKRNARLVLDLMRVFVENNENMAIRVVGEEGRAVMIRLSTKQISAEFDVVIGEAPLTQQDKQEQAGILQAMGDKLLSVGVVNEAKQLYAASVDLMELDYGTKEKVKEAFGGQQQVDPNYVKQLEQQIQKLQSDMSQAQLQNVLANVEKTNAEVAAKLADAKKTDAETIKTLEEGKGVNAKTTQTLIENNLAPSASEVKVNI